MATIIEDEQLDENAEESQLVGLLAEFDGPKELTAAARKMNRAGFSKFDCYSPFPIHGIDDAMGTKPTRLPFIVLGCAFAGFITAQGMQHFMNGFDYPYIISGKPLYSIPSSLPVTFELSVLFSAFGALLGMLALNGLPQLYNAIFRVESFRGVTSGKFFLGVEAADPQYDDVKTRTFVESLKPSSIEEYYESNESREIPKPFFTILFVLGILALVPPVIIGQFRVIPSNVPRIHPIQDMDMQPKVKAQNTSEFFADGRGMRLPIPGTIPQGGLREDSKFYLGLTSDDVDQATLLPGAKDATGAEVNLNNYPWVTTIPEKIDPITGEVDSSFAINEALMNRGQERYGIFCAPCHGVGGYGDGLVTQRATLLTNNGKGSWIQPVSFHVDAVRKQPDGQLFNTITHGKGKMPGYSDQIPPEDRWAIILYLRALQKSQNASVGELPEGRSEGDLKQLEVGLQAAEPPADEPAPEGDSAN